MLELKSERLSIKSIAALKFEELRMLDADPDVMKYTSKGKIRTEGESKVWMQKILNHHKTHGFGMMPFYLTNSEVFIGVAGVKYLENTNLPELGYRLVKQHWGNGYGTEIGRLLINYARNTLKFDKLVAVTKPENIPSQQILTKCGFQFKRIDFYYKTEVNYYELELK